MQLDPSAADEHGPKLSCVTACMLGKVIVSAMFCLSSSSLLFFLYDRKAHHSQMKHIFKIAAILVAISAIWIALLETSTVPRSYTWLVSVTDFC